MKNLNSIVEDISFGLLNEMAMAQLQDKDVLKKISEKNYKEAVDLYLEKGGAIGAGASPKRTITALRGKVIAQDPRFKEITLENIDDFEQELLKRHEEAKNNTKQETKETKEEIAKDNTEKRQRLTAEPSEEENAKEKTTDKDVESYMASFPEKIRKEFGKKLLKDYEEGYLVPKEFRNDQEWIANSFETFDLDTKEGKKLNRVAQAMSSREARQKVRSKIAKSSLEKQQSKNDYDQYGYPTEDKFKKEKEIAEYIKKASLIEIKITDTDEERSKKEQKLLELAEKILAARKVFVLKTDDDTFVKMPEKTDELYPLAKAILNYKKNGEAPNVKKLMLGIKRIGTHSPATIREKTKKRIDDEINVAFSEIAEINSKTTLDELKNISKEILKIVGYSAKEKPSRVELLEYPEYFNAMNFLWMINYGPLKDAADVEIEKVKNYLKFIKKEGIKNLVDLKWAGEPNTVDAVMGKEKQAQELSPKLKENTMIKDQILRETFGKEPDREKDFFFSLASGFAKDYNIFGEDTKSFYEDVFGTEYYLMFEEFQDNIEILTEEDYGSPFRPALPGAPPSGPGALGAGNLKNLDALTKEAVPAKSSFLNKMWTGLKTFGARLALRFPKLAGVLQKGLGWITANPLAVAGIAGGALLLSQIIKALRKRGENKTADKLQKTLDKNKEVTK